MVFLPVFVAAALGLGVAVGGAVPSWLSVLAVLAGVSWLAAVWTWWRPFPRVAPGAGLVAMALLGAVLGAVAIDRAQAPSLVRTLDEAGALPALDGDARQPAAPVRLEGRLAADAAIDVRRVLLTVDATRTWSGPCGCVSPVEGRVLLSVAGEAAATAAGTWRAGRTIALVASLRRPSSYRNPGAPDEARALARRRIALVGSVKSAWLVDVVRPGTWLDEQAAALRARARAAIAGAAGAGTETAAVATAVLIGDRAGLSPQLEDRLQRAGTFHVIAISGGNIALWAVLAIGIATRLTRHRGLALAAAAAALLSYALVVGGGASVLRATGMALVALACQALDQRGAVVNVLAITAAALIVVDPLVAFDVGFWLTTAATAGLVVGLPPLPPALSRWRALVRGLVLSSVWAELALLPIVAAVFQQITLAGVVLSALAIPAMGVVQVGALVAVLADAVLPSVLGATGQVLHLATAAVTGSARLVDWWPWLTWRVPPPSAGAVSLYYAAIAAWLWAHRAGADRWLGARLRPVSLVAMVVTSLWIALAPATLVRVAPGDLRVTFFDVGQGDATLIVTPTGQRLLVDAGGVMADGRDLGARVVGPALRSMGVRRLDTLVITHADADHIGGAATLVREFQPGEVWIGVPVADHGASRALRQAADDVGAIWRQVRRGEGLEVGGVRIAVRHPPPPDWERQSPRNDDSVVLDVRYGDVRVWLPGDAGTEVEATLAYDDGDAGAPAPFTVLKVAHHGSAGASSAAALEALRPAVAVVSAGAANPFGHPAPATMARLRGTGAAIWRTDRDGAVTVRTNGHAVEVAAVAGPTRWFAAQPR